MEEEEGDEFLKVLRALRDAARTVESGSDDGGPALHALLALDAGKDHLLAGDPELRALCRVLATVRALSWSLELCAGEPEGGGGLVGELRARCRRCKTRRGIARAAGDVAREIQAWMDRELAKRLVAALRREGDEDGRASALLAELEARLMGLATEGRFDSRLQDAVLRHGVYAAVEARLGGGDPPVSDGCAALVLALVRFNRDVFVGPVLMGPAVGALVSSSASSPAPLRALNGLVDAIRTPLVDELHGRGELPKLVALLFAAGGGDPRVRALALELVLRVAYYGRGEVLDALLSEGLVKRLLCLQRSDLGGSSTDDSHEKSNSFAALLGWRHRQDESEEGALWTSRRPFVSAVARFAVQVEVGQGLGPREKRLAKLDILRRVREAAVSPAEEATVVAEVLWGATP